MVQSSDQGHGRASKDGHARTAAPATWGSGSYRASSPCARVHELVPLVFHHAFMRAVAVAD